MAKNRLYSPEFLKELVADPSSSVELKKSVKEILLQPFHLRDIAAAVAEILDSSLLRLDASLDGLLLGYQNAKRLGDKAPCHLESSLVSVKIQADFYVFRPKIGNTYKAVVSNLGLAHIGCHLYNHLNVSLPLPPDKLGLLETVTPHTQVTFILEEFDLTNELPFFKGQLATISSMPAAQPTDSKKSKKLKEVPKAADLNSSQRKEDIMTETKKKEKQSKLALNEGKIPKIALLESKVEAGSEASRKKRSLSLKQSKTVEGAGKVESEDDDPDRLITPFQRPTEKSRSSFPNLESGRDSFKLATNLTFIKSLRESPLKRISRRNSFDSDSDLDLPKPVGASPKSVASPLQKKSSPVKAASPQAAPLFSFFASKSSPAKPALGSLLADVSPIKGVSSQESISIVTSTQKSPAKKSPRLPWRDEDSSEGSGDEAERGFKKKLADSEPGDSSSEEEGPPGQELVPEDAKTSSESSEEEEEPAKIAKQLVNGLGQGQRGGETSSEDGEPHARKDGSSSESEDEPVSTKQRSKELPKPAEDSDSEDEQTERVPKQPSRTKLDSDSESDDDTVTPAHRKSDSAQRSQKNLLNQSSAGAPTKESSAESSSDDEKPRLFSPKQDPNKSRLAPLSPKKPPVNQSLNRSSSGDEKTGESSAESSSDDEEPRLFSPKQDPNKSRLLNPPVNRSSGDEKAKESSAESSSDEEEPRLFSPKQDPNKSRLAVLSPKKPPVNQSLNRGSSSAESSSDDEEPMLSPPKQDLNKSALLSQLRQKSALLSPKKPPVNQSLNPPVNRSSGDEKAKESSAESSSDDEEPRLFPPKQDPNKSGLAVLSPKKPPVNQTLNQNSSSAESSSDDEEPRLFPPKQDPKKPGLPPLSLKKPHVNQTCLDASVQPRSPLACSTPTNEETQGAHKNSLIRSVLKRRSGIGQTPVPDTKKKSKGSSKQSDFESPRVKSSRNKSDSGVDVRRSGESDSDDLEESDLLIAARLYTNISPKIVTAEKKKEDSKKTSKLAVPQRSLPVGIGSTKEDAATKEIPVKKVEKAAIESDRKKSNKRKLEESEQDTTDEGGKKEKLKKRKLFSSKTDGSFIGANSLGNISETILASESKQTDAKAKLDHRSVPSRGAAAKEEKKSSPFASAQPDVQADPKKEVTGKKKRAKTVGLDDSITEIMALIGKDIGIGKPKKEKKKKKKGKDTDSDTDAVRMPPPGTTSTIPVSSRKNSTEIGREKGLEVSGPTQESPKPLAEGDSTSKKKSKKKKEQIVVAALTSNIPVPAVIAQDTRGNEDLSKSRDMEDSSSKKKSKKKKEEVNVGSGLTSNLPVPAVIAQETRVNEDPSKSRDMEDSSSKKKSKKKKEEVSVGSGLTSNLPVPVVIAQETRGNEDLSKSRDMEDSSSKKKSKKKKEEVSGGSGLTSNLPVPAVIAQETRVNEDPSKSRDMEDSSSKKKKSKKKEQIGLVSGQTSDLPVSTAIVQETRVNEDPSKSRDMEDSSSKKKKSKKKKEQIGLVSGQTSDLPVSTAIVQETRVNEDPSKSQNMEDSSSKKKSKKKKEEVSVGSGLSSNLHLQLPSAISQETRVNPEALRSQDAGELSSKKKSKKKERTISVGSGQLSVPTAITRETAVNQEFSKSQDDGESSSKKKSKKKKNALSVGSGGADLPVLTGGPLETRVNPSKSQPIAEVPAKKKSKKKREDPINSVSGQTAALPVPTAVTLETRLNQEPSKSLDVKESSSKKKSKRKMEDAGSGLSDAHLSSPVDSGVPAKKKVSKTEKKKSKPVEDSGDSDDDADLAGIFQNLLKNAGQFVSKETNEVAEKHEKKKTARPLLIKKCKAHKVKM